jgi:hypothetical protein
MRLPARFEFPAGAVVIHGGQHKTGSTAIQDTLYRHREALRECGWLYPQAGLLVREDVGTRHYWLMDALRRGRPAASPAWDELRAELRDWPGRVLLSHENFFCRRIDPHRILRALGHGNVFMVAYLRHPVDYLDSCYREWVRRNGFEGGVRAFYEERADWLDVAGILDLWDEAAGPGRVVLRPYVHGASAVSDLQALCGFASLGLPDARGNPSQSSRQALVHRVGNRLGASPRKRELVAALLDGPLAPELEAVFAGPACRLLREGHVADARVVDDALCDDIEARYLPGYRAALERCGVDPQALGESALRRRPFDARFEDLALHDAIGRLLRRRLLPDNAQGRTSPEKERH